MLFCESLLSLLLCSTCIGSHDVGRRMLKVRWQEEPEIYPTTTRCFFSSRNDPVIESLLPSHPSLTLCETFFCSLRWETTCQRRKKEEGPAVVRVRVGIIVYVPRFHQDGICVSIGRNDLNGAVVAMFWCKAKPCLRILTQTILRHLFLSQKREKILRLTVK